MQTLTTPAAEARAAVPIESGPVRVCFLIDELAVAGTETQLLALIRCLDRSRVTPHLALLRGASATSRALEPADCPVWRLGVGGLLRPGTIGKAIQFVRLLRRHRIDLVQAYFPDSSYFGLPLAWAAGVRHRIRTRNNVGHWLTLVHRVLGRGLNLFATGAIANCRAARDALVAAEGVARDAIQVLENGVDLGRFLTLARPAAGATPVVGAVGNLRPVKGVDVLVEAAAVVARRRTDVVFRVAGEGGERANLEAATARLGLAGRFELAGATRDVPGFLGGLSVAVLPSRAEGMSNALLEYMAAGRPVVATAVGANPELITHGVDGLLVLPGEPGALADAIESLLADPEWAGRLGDAARRKARERYSREAMVRRFEDYYAAL
jgi:glycosyltransferase involved in cell wall biosynthesis